jgi:hypothetical protein
VTLRSTQRGAVVKGALNVPAADAGARLEVDLLVRGARGRSLVVGRAVHRAVGAGEVSFALKPRARAALGSRRRLVLTVRIVLKPTHGPAVTVTRAVVLVR